jgi:hypothetical protein
MLPSELGCPPITKRGSRHSGFREANLRHRAKHSRHHTKDKQRFVVSVVAYDSLPGHHAESSKVLYWAAIFCSIPAPDIMRECHRCLV